MPETAPQQTARSRAEYTAAALNYPEQLPVTGERETILDALREHQVVVVAGETGSGKTTQLPKMLLELGIHQGGIIGHTQPRRLAARTVAERLAEELGTSIGEDIGYQVRFTSEVSKNTAVKLMTDGILLAEIQRDPLLKRYAAIIIDEAHERSLNIDVILGYLRRILPKRPDLKVVITSATIDPERFARHFTRQEIPEDSEELPDDTPIIEVSGRTFPVEIRYRPLRPEAEAADPEDEFGQAQDPAHGEEKDLLDGIAEAVQELAEEPTAGQGAGDILIFFPGEREIRDAADHLADVVSRDRRLSGSEILPLFGRLSMQEQKRVFSPSGRRRIVLATNVAETSLTVPGIKYVIDTGTARISRYSTRTKVQRLPIEPISQASANQRSGRAGRTSPGVAIRLYSEEDFDSRPEFTDPEILRTSLASVLLQMSSMGITRTPEELLEFPFVQKPDSKAVNDAVRLLTELGALERSGTVTTTGRLLSRLPVDPRLGRMMVEAGRRGCLEEVTVLVAALSIQDPRERPGAGGDGGAERAQADELHRRFADDTSDFSALLNVWRYLQQKQEELSGNQFRRLCRREYLNYLRVREWQDLVVQLAEIARDAELGELPKGRRASSLAKNPATNSDAVHQSLLSGLLSHIGLYSPKNRDYQGARGTRFAVFPGSGLFKKNHDWVMAAELVETSRLWARTVARVDPAWIEDLAPHLTKTSYSDPRWSSRKGAVVATQKVTLFGVPVIADRQVLYAKVDPVYSRELFIQRALIEGDWNTRHHFDRRNRERFQEIEELENRTRRKDLRASDEELFAFFDERLPATIVSQRHFDTWWKKQRHETPELLDLGEEHLLADSAEEVDVEAFPEHFDHDGLALELRYEFNPSRYTAGSTGSDGITVRVPVLFLNQLQPHRFSWLIPGLRAELITHLIRSMPKSVRKNFVPAPDVAAQALDRLESDYQPGADPLEPALAAVLQRLRGHVVDPAVFDLSALPDHLRFTFAVISEKGRVLDSGTDLEELQVRFSSESRAAISRATSGKQSAMPTPTSAAAHGSGQPGITDQPAAVSQAREQTSWTFGRIPREVTAVVAGREVTGFPALVPDGAGVRCAVQDSAVEQARVHRSGVVALLRAVLPSPQRYVVDHLSNRERVAFGQFSQVEEIVADATTAALEHLVPGERGSAAELPFTAEEFDRIARSARADLIETVLTLTDLIAQSLTAAAELRSQLTSVRSAALRPAVEDMTAQLDQLVYPGFVTATGYQQLRHMPRYLRAAQIRLERLQDGQAVAKDTTDMQQVQQLEDEYDAAVEAVPPQLAVPEQLRAVKWMIEELRVNLFAQQLGTAQTVSAKRVRRAIKQTTR